MRWWWQRDRDVVRVRRVEVVDAGGEPRVVIGTAEGASAPVGLWVRDAAGSQRIWVGVDDTGASVAIGGAGNVVAAIGVHDGAADAARVGPYVFVTDGDGVPVAGWYVDG